MKKFDRSMFWTTVNAWLGPVLWLILAPLCVSPAVVGDSMVYSFRSTLVATLLLLGAVGSGAALATRRRWRSAALGAPTLLLLWQSLAPTRDAARVLSAGDEAKAIGRHFVVGYSDPSEVADLARRGLIGGVFLTRRNMAGRSVEAVAAEVAALQRLRHDAALPPLVVAADQEGGSVSHLSPPLAVPPPLSAVAALAPAAREEAARQQGERQGRDLARLGVTMDLAPVVDLMPNGPAPMLDLHSKIATRAIAADPAVVAEVAAGFAAGLLEAGITPTAKHFPGLGRIDTDTHLFAAALAAPVASLEAREWPPFRAVLALPGAAVMLSHVAVEALDPAVPASRSRRLVQGLLRAQWHFEGLAITDDLTMGAVTHAGLCRAVEGALDAGIDLLLIAWDTDKTYAALRCAIDAAEAGRLDPMALASSALRLGHFAPKYNQKSQ